MANVSPRGKRPQGCKDCTFWIKGQCHRHAPELPEDGTFAIQATPLATEMLEPEAFDMKPGMMVVLPQGYETTRPSLWPPTQADDWCGDFELSPFDKE